jgi:hypothetical protein
MSNPLCPKARHAAALLNNPHKAPTIAIEVQIAQAGAL